MAVVVLAGFLDVEGGVDEELVDFFIFSPKSETELSNILIGIDGGVIPALVVAVLAGFFDVEAGVGEELADFFIFFSRNPI